MFSVFFLFLWLQGQLPHCFHHASHVLVQGANLTTAVTVGSWIYQEMGGSKDGVCQNLPSYCYVYIFIQYIGKPIVRAIPLYGMPWCTQIQMIADPCWPVHEMPCFRQVVGPTVRPWRKHCSLLLVLFCSVTRHVVGFYFSTFQMF
jgi:hypothetical protein